MKFIINLIKFWQYFNNNPHAYYFWLKTIDQEWCLRIMRDRAVPVMDICLPSKAQCRQEFLDRQLTYTAMEIWEDWPRPEPEDLVVGAQIFYFYGGFEWSGYYDIYTLEQKDIDRLQENPKYIDPIWARIHPNRITINPRLPFYKGAPPPPAK